MRAAVDVLIVALVVWLGRRKPTLVFVVLLLVALLLLLTSV
jgi:hypothetical protein